MLMVINTAVHPKITSPSDVLKHTKQVATATLTLPPLLSMNMSSNPTPLDILFEVTRSLYKDDDHATLSNMSVTCRAVLPLCRARLFYSIEFLLHTPASNEGEVITRLRNLDTLFFNNPILSTYVREFKFGNAPNSGSELLWFINKPELSRLLDSLSQLITFSMVGSLRLMIDWAEFDEDLKRACFRARARPTLKKLYLSSVENVPWRFVTEPVQLYHLNVCEVTLDLEPTSEPPPQQAPQRSLKEFSYGFCEGTLLFLFERAKFDFTKLERLNVDPDDMNDINTGWAIARIAKETLESFEMFPPDSYPYLSPDANTIQIDTFSQLCQMTIDVDLPAIHQLLRTTSFPELLEASIGIRLQPTEIRKEFGAPLVESLIPLLQDIDALIAGPKEKRCMPEICGIDLCFHTGVDEGYDDRGRAFFEGLKERLEMQVMEVFPALCSGEVSVGFQLFEAVVKFGPDESD